MVLGGYNDLELPIMVMACKSDSVKKVYPGTAATMLRGHEVGLVEVSMYDDPGKDKMRRCFDWMIRAIHRARCELFLFRLFCSRSQPLISTTASARAGPNPIYRNPASPEVLNASNHPRDLSSPLLNSPPTDGIRSLNPSAPTSNRGGSPTDILPRQPLRNPEIPSHTPGLLKFKFSVRR